MKQKHAVSIILSCDDVTQRDGGKMNHSNYSSTKLHTYTSVVMFHAQKSMRRGQGVAHGDAQMKQKHAVSIILSCDDVTQRDAGKTNHSNHTSTKLHTFTSVVMFPAQKSMRRGQGVAHGYAQMKQNHSVSIILSGNLVTQRVSGRTNLFNHISIKLHTSTSRMIVHAQESMR